MAASRKLIDENAQMSCEREPGCRRFAVLVPKGTNDRIFLYEICDSRAAFGTHLPSPHLATFNTTSADLVMNENVAKLHLIFEGSNNRR
jgi:(4S)-4-hydroxy-5-phosphonooxypentane-2,3-dione isomerase